MKKYEKYYNFIYAVIFVFVAWFLISISLNSFIVPNPIDVVERLFSEDFMDLLENLGASFLRIIVSLILTTLIGYIVGLTLGINKVAEKIFGPVVYLFFPIPRIAFLPVFMLLFGLGDLSKVILIFAIAVFQIIISVKDGAQQIDDDWILTAETLHMTVTQKLRHLYIPATLPKLFTAMRIALGSSLAALFFAENYATKLGIGYYIMFSWTQVDYIGMYEGIIMISTMGIILFKVLDMLQRKLSPWLTND